VSGVYRNMFLEAGYAQADIDAKVAAAFAQLYLTGDPATQRIAFEVPGNMTYVSDMKNHDVRTEGMSYGMMVHVQLNNQTGFDRIWRWVLTYMYHGDASDPLQGWSAWHCNPDGSRIDQGPALDGETFFVTALYFASARWGDSGAYNYSRWADTVLGLVTAKPTPNEMFEPASRIVRFDPGTAFTDPSYMAVAFYPAWAISGSVTPALWNVTAARTRDVLVLATSQTTGLAPNMCGYDGSKAGWVTTFEDDAWRVARNWALDYAWWAADPRQIAMSNTILAFFAKCGNPCSCDYFDTQTGQCQRPQYSSGLAAMNAVAALASNSSLAWAAVDALWAMPIPSGDEHDTDRYYSGSLYLEALLHLSGRYRAWL
jgi:oligosaccharide reducing-end xylanase